MATITNSNMFDFSIGGIRETTRCTGRRLIMKNESEFGKGFIYNFILFAQHRFFMIDTIEKLQKTEGIQGIDYSMWFNGAGDHLFELEIHKQLNGTRLGDRIERWRDLGIKYRGIFIRNVTKEMWIKHLDEMESISRELDKQIFGIKDIKAEWG